MHIRPPPPDESSELQPALNQAEVVEQLFREHNEALLRFIRARVATPQEAHEVAQEAYVRLLSLDEPGAVSYLRTFLFRIAANIAIDRQRRHHNHDEATRLPAFREFADPRTPERQVAGEQTLRRLESLVAAMPVKCRQSFVMHQIHGIDAATVAAQLGISESMVRKYVVRALLHCRERIDLEELHEQD